MRVGIEPVQRFDRILEQADVLAVDNSSVLYEFAATDRPVVAINAKSYRRDVHHGLRFWDHIPGVQCDSPADLPGAILTALDDAPEWQATRRAAMDVVFPIRDGRASERAASALLEFLL